MGNCNKSSCCLLCKGDLSTFFTKSSSSIIAELSEIKSSKKYASGDALFLEGEASSGIYCIVKGNVKLVKNHCKPKERIVHISSENDILAANTILDEENFNYSAFALNNVSAFFLPKKELISLVEKHPSIVIDLLKHIESEISDIQWRATQILQLPTEKRLIAFLLMIFKKYSVAENGFINISLSPKDFANLLHTTRATVYRIFKKLEDACLIKVEKHKIQLLDIPKMELIVGI